MITKEQIINQARLHGFEDVGFTSAAPFDDHKTYLDTRQAEYGWAKEKGLALLEGTDPRAILPQAKTIIVLMEVYFRQAFPREMEGHFGRCYLDDDRITKDGLAKRIRAFRGDLMTHGIKTKVPFNLPHRAAAARAGMGTRGKNCLFYSSRAARKSSWVLPIAVVIDQAYEPDTPPDPPAGSPTIEMGCPNWCRNACIAACPTRALKGNGTIDPRLCISYLTYFGEDLTPEPLREPMGIMVYGCDRCQTVCPRNAGWLAKDLVPNPRAAAKAPDFTLSNLLKMDKTYFEEKIWPHMFYMDAGDIWRWKMNVARAMGNTNDLAYVPELATAFKIEEDERVRSMIAWALGKLGSPEAVQALEAFTRQSRGMVAQEIDQALSMAAPASASQKP